MIDINYLEAIVQGGYETTYYDKTEIAKSHLELYTLLAEKEKEIGRLKDVLRKADECILGKGYICQDCQERIKQALAELELSDK
jgi:hypothetical protein